MMELKLYEAVEPGTNARGEMGRVCVPPPRREKRDVQETGSVFLCCNKFFLTYKSFETHRATNCKTTAENTNELSINDTIMNACNVNSENVGRRKKLSCIIVDVAPFVERRYLRQNAAAAFFSCIKCTFRTSNIMRIARHIKGVHSQDIERLGEIVYEDDVENSVENESKLTQYYKCDLCSIYSSVNKYNIVLHKQTAHVPNGGFPCAFCKCCYGSQDGLTLHLHRVHNGRMNRDGLNPVELVKKSECPGGSQMLDSSEIKKESNTSSVAKTSFVAGWVQQATEELEKQTEPTEASRNISTKRDFSVYKCLFCPKLFDRKSLLVLHNRQQHLATESENSPPSPVKKPRKFNRKKGRKRTETKVIRCKYCKWVYTSTWLLHSHQSVCKNRKASIQVKTETDDSSDTETEMEVKKEIPSNSAQQPDFSTTMNDFFTNISKKFALNRANASGRAASSRNDTRCELCTFTAKDTMEMNCHIRTAHVFLGVECECGCSFATATELTNHKSKDCKKNCKIETLDVKVESPVIKQEPIPIQKYECDCGKSFGNKRRLDKHKELCVNESTASVNTEMVKNHERMIQNSVPSPAKRSKEIQELCEVQCPHCKKTLKNEMGLRNHIAAMHAKFDVCEICEYRTHNYRNYKRHKRTCHVLNGIQCPECVCSFKSIEGLQSHTKMLHKMKLDTTLLELKCEQCSFVTFASSDMEKHRLKGHMNQNMLEIKKILKCDLCNFEAQNLNYFKRHMETNHVEDGVKCNVCNNSFASEMGLRAHSKMMHKISTPSVCQLCGFRAGGIKGFKEHMQRCHSGSYKCPQCVCSFRHTDGLSKHMLIMHKIKLDKSSYLLKCSFSDCQYTTYYSGNLRHHVTTKHNSRKHEDKKAKLIDCPLCGAKVGNIQDHASRAHVEDGFSCLDNCGCSFRTKNGLRSHMKMKHGKTVITKEEKERDPTEFPVECSKCNFRCKTINSLSIHSFKSHGIRIPLPLKSRGKRECPICHVQFTGTVVAHKRTYHVPNGFKCLQNDCPCSFETYHSRSRHMKRAHQIVVKKRCNVCHLKFLGTIEEHTKRCHVENGIRCEFKGCPCSFETEAGMRIHFRIQHDGTCAKLTKWCKLCESEILGTIQKHISRCHVTNGLPCNFCSCSFETEQGRMQHMIKKHNIVVSRNCTICGIKPVVSMSKHLQRSHVPGGIPCTHCGCSFENEVILSRHMQRYHNVQPVRKTCTICNMKISITMPKHLRLHHAPGGFECKSCNWSLATKTGLAMHMRKIHNEIMVFGSPTKVGVKKEAKQCPICGLAFTCSLEKHMETSHLSTNHFKCGFCPSKFSSSLGRSRHVLQRHKNACKERIRVQFPKRKHPEQENSASLNKRLKQSVTETCKKPEASGCGSTKSSSAQSVDSKSPATNNKSDIVTQSLVQNLPEKGKPFPKEQLTCTKCGYLASSKSLLNMHLQKSHVRNSPFTCDRCPCSYATRNELLRHVKVFHPEFAQPDLLSVRLWLD